MIRTRAAARLGATTVTGAWLLATAATGAWAVPGPVDTAGPVAPAATVRQATPSGSHRVVVNDNAATRPADLHNKIAVYRRYLAREQAQDAAAAQQPSLPSPPREPPTVPTPHDPRVVDTGPAGWTIGAAAAAGLVLGAGMTVAATRYLRPAGRLHHA